MTGPPRKTFEDAIRDFAIDVLGVASIRETTARGSTSEVVQYTSAYFEAAKVQVRNAGYVRRPPRWYPWAKVVSPVAFVFAGIAVPLAFASNPWPGWGIVAGVSFVLGIVLSLLVELKIGVEQ